MTNDDRRDDDTRIERDHPQTRKGETDARGSSECRDDVEPPEGERKAGEDKERSTVSELAEEAEEVREEAVGENHARNAFGSDKAAPE